MTFTELRQQFQRRKEIEADKQALNSFVENFHWGEDLSNREAKANLENGIVEIIDHSGYHLANGLLITNNGYFLTNHHCVDHDLLRLFIRLADDTSYPIARICSYNKANDVALVKANIPGTSEARRYKFAHKHNQRKQFPIVVLERMDGKILLKGGFVGRAELKHVDMSDEDEELIMYNQVCFSGNMIPGDSGGTVVTMDYQVYGFACTGAADEKTKGIMGSCSFLFTALELVKTVAYKPWLSFP